MTPLAFAIGVAAGCLACWLYREWKQQSRARQISAWVRQDQERERMAREELDLARQLERQDTMRRALSGRTGVWVRGGEA